MRALRQLTKLFDFADARLSSCISATLLLMELNEGPFAPTLAQKMGDAAHVSGLAIRLAQESGAGERLLQWLMKVAVERGATHYQREFDAMLPPDNRAITDEEIGIALCLEQHPYDLDQLRAAAQLLSSRRVDAARLGRLAVQERCEPVLLHIAGIAMRYAPQQEPWATLRKQIPPRWVPRTDMLPHWTRLVSHTSVTREGPPRTDWLCRHE
jgi:hypothetical protein